MTLSGLQVVANAAAAVSCRGGSTLYVRDAQIRNNGGRGLDAENDCAKLFIDRTRVNNTIGYGIVVGMNGTTTVDFSITNTALTATGSSATSEEYAVARLLRNRPPQRRRLRHRLPRAQVADLTNCSGAGIHAPHETQPSDRF